MTEYDELRILDQLEVITARVSNLKDHLTSSAHADQGEKNRWTRIKIQGLSTDFATLRNMLPDEPEKGSRNWG